MAARSRATRRIRRVGARSAATRIAPAAECRSSSTATGGMRELLIVFGGLTGTGKSTIARELTSRVAATYLRIDAIERSLHAAGLAVGATGFAIANALAAENLLIGRT